MVVPDALFTDADFAHVMGLCPALLPRSNLAVAVSGGPDSMALACMLSRWMGGRQLADSASSERPEQEKGDPPVLHCLTVDHGLRPESEREAQQVHNWFSDGVIHSGGTQKETVRAPEIEIVHSTLKWEGEKPDARIMEEARKARYALMGEYCRAHGVGFLFLAHHQDDQAETFLFRLAKGSGLDGLAAMGRIQHLEQGPALVRPLLDVPKEALLAYCRDHEVPYLEDPSNVAEKYARPRLRKARAVLEKEGLSYKRLALTARRLRRARAALEDIAQQAYDSTVKEQGADRIVFDYDALMAWPDEIALRALLRAIRLLYPGGGYGPRMEKAENLLLAFKEGRPVRQTLGRCLFTCAPEKGLLEVKKEPEQGEKKRLNRK